MHAKLSPSEKALLNRKPTENGEAYLAFVKAHTLHRQVEDSDKLLQAEQLYERALELDPKFALAAAQLSRLESWLYRCHDPSQPRREKARALAERAIQLQPDCAEGHLALGFSYYYGDRDYENAMKEFAIAQRGLPNEADVYLAIGAIQRRQGKWKESNANLEKAASLSPNETWPLQNLTLNYEVLRDFEAANRTIDKALKLNPDSLSLRSIKAQSRLAKKAASRSPDACLQTLTPEQAKSHMASRAVQVLVLERKYAEALRAAESVSDEMLTKEPDALPMKYMVIGIAKKLQGDEAGSREAFLAAKRLTEKYVNDAPNEAGRHRS